MSVKGLKGMSSIARKKEKVAHPSNFSASVYTMCTYNVTSKPTGRSYLQAPTVSNFLYVKAHAHACRYHHAPQRRRSEAHRAADVHRVAEHVKRESLNAMVHQNAKIVPQERARYAERPRRAHDERLACGEEHCGQDRVERSGEQWHARLLEESAPVSGMGELESRK